MFYVKYVKATKATKATKAIGLSSHEWRRLRRYTGTLHMYTNSFISLRVLGRLLHEHARCINE